MPLLAGPVVVVSGRRPGPGARHRAALRRGPARTWCSPPAPRRRLDEVAKEVTALGPPRGGGPRGHHRRRVRRPPGAGRAGRSSAGWTRWCNNAFAIPPLTSLADADLDAIRAAFETNVLAALRLTRLFTPALAASGGSVVMINSAVLRHSRLPYGGYKMAKSALLALAEAWPPNSARAASGSTRWPRATSGPAR